MKQGRSIRIMQEYIEERERARAARDRSPPLPAVTISRMAGAGGLEVALGLERYLQTRRPQGTPRWVTFDRNLIDRVLDDQNLPKRLAEFMPERRISEVDALVGEAIGLHPSTLTLMRKQTETVVRLARLGHAVIVGRGGCIVTRHMPNVLHVRLIGSEASRLKRVMHREHVGPDSAAAWIRSTDRDREAYFKQQFNRDAGDSMLYHLTLSTELFSVEEAVELIGLATLQYGRAGAEALPVEPLAQRVSAQGMSAPLEGGGG